MKRLLSLVMGFALAGMILASCGQAAAPSPADQTKSPVPGTTTSPSKTVAEEQWDIALAQAKKEGSVGIYSMWPPETRIALSRAFTDRYGISLEFSSFGSSSELGAKAQAENRAGLLLADVYGAGPPAMYTYLKPHGLLGNIKSLLILPEVTDPKAYRFGALPFADEQGLSLAMGGITQRTVVYNTDLIKDGEITALKDLLRPQYKGKIAMLDPSFTSNLTLVHLAVNLLWTEAEVVGFLRRLIEEQKVYITRNARLQLESVARGKYAVAFPPSATVLPTFLATGAPVKLAAVQEDNRILSGSGTVGASARSPHPNAALVFVNWLLTREGQLAFSRSFGMPSFRLDVPTEGIEPMFIPVEGKKYFRHTQKFLDDTDKWLEIAKNTMEQAIK